MISRPTSMLISLAMVSAGLLADPTSATGTVAAATGAPPTARHIVTLVTGDRVAVTTGPGGRPVITVPPGRNAPATDGGTGGSGGGNTSFQVLSSGPHLYVVPRDAVSFVGQPLDLSLFDVKALIAGGYADDTKALPVQVTPTPGSRPAPPPGMTSAGTDLVRQPRDRAAAFGAALRTSAAAVRRGQPAGHLFDGIARLALPGTAPTTGGWTAPRAGTPRPGPQTGTPATGAPATGTQTGTAATGTATTDGKLYTLRVKAFDRNGQRVTGALVSVMNADNVETFLAAASLFNGEMAYSVPAGTYSIASYIDTMTRDGRYDTSLVTQPQVQVTRDSVVVLDARRATRVGVHTPDPTTPLITNLALQRNPVTGLSFTTSLLAFGDVPLYATPTAPVDRGALYFYPSTRLGDPDGGSQRYVYDLAFPYTGSIPADLDPTVTRDQLATVDARYHSPQPGRVEADQRVGIMPWQADVTFLGSVFTAPLARTEYVLPHPDMLFTHYAIEHVQDFAGSISDVLRRYTPGQRVTEEWGAAPTGTGIEQQAIGGQSCPACRSGDALSVMLFPHADNAGHFELPDAGMATTLDLYTDGAATAHADSGFASLPMSPDPASYRLVLDAAGSAPWAPTSTHVRTEWTFDSAERPADPLPEGWICGGKGGGGRAAPAGGGGDTGCSFEPLLFLRYRANSGVDDVIPAGTPARIGIDVLHQRGAAASAIVGMDASVSFDDGATWRPVPAHGDGDGKFTVEYPQPTLDATNGFAALRISAWDAAGSRISQTVTRAYPLSVTPPAPPGGGPGSGAGSGGPGRDGVQAACATPVAPPYTRCMALVNAPAAGDAAASTGPSGYGPADVRSAYRLPADGGDGKVVAIVDAYDNPNVEADLNAYRAHYGLPPCTTANGCFRKVNQRGAAAPLPAPDPGWGLEIDLDVQAVSAACPRCHILLVEADSSSVADLGPAVRTAVGLGADVVSNSYGSAGEFSGEQYFEPYYKQNGVPVVVSSGDYGYGNGLLLLGSVSYPAASQYVVAVGGTSLSRADNARGWTEAAWDGATSGCSAYIHKPGWQKDTLCDKRTVADVAAVADPATGLAVYDTYGWSGGWLTVGGTSAAAPVVSAVYALAGGGGSPAYGQAGDLYQQRAGLFDVVGGSNGNCGGTYLCTAVPGYDGPTGLGTPDGVAAF